MSGCGHNDSRRERFSFKNIGKGVVDAGKGVGKGVAGVGKGVGKGVAGVGKTVGGAVVGFAKGAFSWLGKIGTMLKVVCCLVLCCGCVVVLFPFVSPLIAAARAGSTLMRAAGAANAAIAATAMTAAVAPVAVPVVAPAVAAAAVTVANA